MSHFPTISLSSATVVLALTLNSAPCPVQQVFNQVQQQQPPPPVATATDADLFDNTVLHDLHLTIRAEDLATLREHYGDNTYYPADLTWRDVTVRNVAVRSRGFDSRDWNKLGLLIDMNRDTPGQTFLGLKSLVLDNLRQDPAMMREVLAMTMFARMGQPAPRAAFCRVFLNNEYEGLYAMIENIDKTFLKRVFDQDAGYLFEYHWLKQYNGEYLGSDYAVYKSFLEARTHSSESDWTLYEPIRAMFEAVNAPEEITGRSAVEALVDLEQFVRVLAIEKVMTDQDGFAGFFGLNNFYMHRAAAVAPHTFLVWDRDRSLTPELVWASIFFGVYDNAIARRALAYDDLYDLYLRTAEDTARSLSDNGWLSAEVDRLWTMISTAAYSDTRKPYSNAELDEALNALRQIAIDRPAIVLNELGSLRPRVQRER